MKKDLCSGLLDNNLIIVPISITKRPDSPIPVNSKLIIVQIVPTKTPIPPETTIAVPVRLVLLYFTKSSFGYFSNSEGKNL